MLSCYLSFLFLPGPLHTPIQLLAKNYKMSLGLNTPSPVLTSTIPLTSTFFFWYLYFFFNINLFILIEG